MSFLDKKFKRVGAEGIEELMDAMKVEEKFRALMKKGGNVSYFTKNDDDTYSYVVEFGENKSSSNFKLNEECDWARPDGVTIKSRFELEGDTLRQKVVDPSGVEVTFVRVFSGNKMTMTITALDLEGKVYYEQVE